MPTIELDVSSQEEASGVDVFAQGRREVRFQTALVIFDANALLLPYTASNDSLPDIRKVLEGLRAEKRLVVPGQVAREYARNRSRKIADLYKSLTDTMSEAPPETEVYPLLSSLPEYTRLKEMEAGLHAQHKEYRKQLEAVRARVREWSWTDPVRDVYASVFGSDVVTELNIPPDRFEAIRAERYRRKSPPGYKDAGKDDGGGGDLAIWLTLLQVAKNRQLDAVLVSADEKADWFQQSGGAPLFPRWELQDEFRRTTKGHVFTSMRLSRLLEQMSARREAVEDIRRSEAAASRSRGGSRCIQPKLVQAWLQDQYPGAIISAHPRGAHDAEFLILMPGAEGPIVAQAIHARLDPADMHLSQPQLFSRVDPLVLFVCHNEDKVLRVRDLLPKLGLPRPGQRVLGASPRSSGLHVLWSLP